MWMLIGSIMFQSVTSLMLFKQRHDNDMEFMAKVEQIRKENAELRAKLAR